MFKDKKNNEMMIKIFLISTTNQKYLSKLNSNDKL